MKNKLLTFLLVLTSLWAAIVTVLYLQLRNNPRVISVLVDPLKGHVQSEELTEMEKLTFLRQFLDRYFNYDSHSFWQSQTSLAFLMTPQLGEKRIVEVSRLREKIQNKNLIQAGKLESLTVSSAGDFTARIHLKITEGTRQNDLYTQLRLRLHKTDRTLENPWGLLVQEMSFLANSPNKDPFAATIRLGEKTPAILAFPCALENLHNPDENILKIKITTMNVSELQIFSTAEITTPLSLSAACKDYEFHWSLQSDNKNIDLFRLFPEETGIKRKNKAGKPAKDIYEKTIESVLGIEL